MKLSHYFIPSTSALLLAAALAALLGNLAGVGHLQPHDPVLGISFPWVCWVFCGSSLAVGWICLWGRKTSLQLPAVLWLGGNLGVYLAAVRWQSAGGFGSYLQDVAAAFAVAPGLVNALLQGLTLYLLIGSTGCLLLQWYRRSASGQARAACVLKMACPTCGGHIQFPAANLGHTIPCPHCQNALTLRSPAAMVKTSCFFCLGHIEFPAHSIGSRTACPHCQMDITLKEPR